MRGSRGRDQKEAQKESEGSPGRTQGTLKPLEVPHRSLIIPWSSWPSFWIVPGLPVFSPNLHTKYFQVISEETSADKEAAGSFSSGELQETGHQETLDWETFGDGFGKVSENFPMVLGGFGGGLAWPFGCPGEPPDL